AFRACPEFLTQPALAVLSLLLAFRLYVRLPGLLPSRFGRLSSGFGLALGAPFPERTVKREAFRPNEFVHVPLTPVKSGADLAVAFQFASPPFERFFIAINFVP